MLIVFLFKLQIKTGCGFMGSYMLALFLGWAGCLVSQANSPLAPVPHLMQTSEWYWSSHLSLTEKVNKNISQNVKIFLQYFLVTKPKPGEPWYHHQGLFPQAWQSSSWAIEDLILFSQAVKSWKAHDKTWLCSVRLVKFPFGKCMLHLNYMSNSYHRSLTN